MYPQVNTRLSATHAELGKALCHGLGSYIGLCQHRGLIEVYVAFAADMSEFAASPKLRRALVRTLSRFGIRAEIRVELNPEGLALTGDYAERGELRDGEVAMWLCLEGLRLSASDAVLAALRRFKARCPDEDAV